MDRLGQLLGKSLKRGDFGIDNDGYVASGCPLTARRIKFILAKTEAVAAREAAATGEAVRTILPNGGVRKCPACQRKVILLIIFAVMGVVLPGMACPRVEILVAS